MSNSLRPHGLQPTRLPRPLISQTTVLEWGATAFSNAWEWRVKVKSLSRARLLATPWTAAHQAPLSLGSPMQEDWSGCHRLLCALLCWPIIMQLFFFLHTYLSLTCNSWWNSYSSLFSIFLVGGLILLSCKSPLYNWDASPDKSDSCFANIFSLAKGFIF